MPPCVVLKLDDYQLDNGTTTNSRWSRCIDDLIARGLNASAGVIGDRCVTPNAAAIEYVQNAAAHGIEFWGHGWTHSPVYEFKGREVDFQLAHIMETALHVRRVFGVPCDCFGAPYNEIEVATGCAVKAAGVKVWLFPQWGKGLEQAYPTVKYLSRGGGEIESATGVPSMSLLEGSFDGERAYICLQAHPCSFATETAWTQWNACLDWLVAQGCEFKTPCEYFNL